MDLDELERKFLTQGFIVVSLPKLTDQLVDLLPVFEKVIEKAEALGALGEVKVRKSNLEAMTGRGWSWGCDHIFTPRLREQRLLDIVSLEPIPTLVHRLLGSRVCWTGGHGHWSPVTYDYYLHWHRDTRPPLWGRGNADGRCHVQVCVALTDESVVRIVPGSHLRDLEDWEQQFLSRDRHRDHPDQVVVDIPAGSALLFNTYTFHRAQCAKEKVRRAIHFGFTRADAPPEPGRLGKYFDWLADPAFGSRQSTFLQGCIREQVLAQERMLPLVEVMT